MKKLLILPLLFLLLTSCDDSNDFSDSVDVAVVPQSAALVPTLRESCNDIHFNASSDTTVRQQSLASSSVAWHSFQINWKETKRDFFVIKIRLDLTEAFSGGGFSDITDPVEIDFLFGTNGGKMSRKGSVENPTDHIYRTDQGSLPCPLPFGGINPPAGIASTTSLVKIIVTGIAIDDAQNEEVIQVNTSAKLIISTN